MATRIKGAASLDKELTKMLQEYGEEVLDDVSKAIIKVADDGVMKLKSTSMPPASSTGNANPSTRRQWKNYTKSWTSTAEVGKDYIHATIHNKKYYRLTHLLEYGHVTRNGTHTRGFKHIEPVNDWAIENLEKEIKKGIEK